MSKWRDMHLRVQLPEGLEPTDPSLNSGEVVAEFAARFGKPPSQHKAPDEARPTIELPILNADGEFFDVLRQRKTTRDFNPRAPMRSKDFSLLLQYVFGCHGYAHIHDDIVGVKKTS